MDMSEVQNFQSSENWRNIIKTFLTMERKSATKQKNEIKESDRRSLDIGEDLQNILEERTRQINIKKKMEEYQKMLTDETVIDTEPGGLMQISNESFEALERMCDKTLSDPNNTIFKYMKADNKDQILAAMKKRADGNEANVSPQMLLQKLKDCTVLDEIEAPSHFWDNTVDGENEFQMSPIKMVGLLRPSTIMEEACEDSVHSDISSPASFETAAKCTLSGISSAGTYGTAKDFTCGSSACSIPVTIQNQSSIEPDRNTSLVYNADNLTFVDNSTLDDGSRKNATVVTANNRYGQEEALETDCNEPNSKLPQINAQSPLVNSGEDSDESVIEISDEEKDNEVVEANIGTDEISCQKNTAPQKTSQILKDIKAESIMSLSFESDKENCYDSNIETSLQFNDTMEEVEYMLKKGMEYMASDGMPKNKSDKTKSLISSQFEKSVLSTPKTPEVSATQSYKCSINKSVPKAKPCATKSEGKAMNNLARSIAKKADRYAIDIKPFPKLDLFAKPTNKRQKELSHKFSHVVSPIGTYMKKTAVTPLMANIKCRRMKNDVLDSTAFQELEKESRLYKLQVSSNGGASQTGGKKIAGLNPQYKPLPKKAYISSDRKHITDERTPTTIPGGAKIQKYIESAVLPAVVRHEGKLKMNAAEAYKALDKNVDLKLNKKPESMNDVKCRTNASLANLSVMSGDISVYTIKDAQKL
ncbi:septin interacting protein 2 isoform 1-T1 [Glossina fuscipes fuscipes]